MNSTSFLQMIRETTVPEGSAAAWWLGQMGFFIKMGNTVLSIDYYAFPRADRQVPPPVPAKELTGIDLFLGTHDHEDHIDRPSWLIWQDTCPGASFLCSRAHTASLAAEGMDAARLIGINEGESVNVGDVTVRAVAAAHEFLDRDPQTGVYPHLQYILEGNGVRIYHAGDTLRYEGMLGKLLSAGRIDAAILPINGRDAERYRRNIIGNMTYQESADLAGDLRPGLVIPGHWDMFAGNDIDPSLFADYLDAKYEGQIPCHIPKHMERICIQASL